MIAISAIALYLPRFGHFEALFDKNVRLRLPTKYLPKRGVAMQYIRRKAKTNDNATLAFLIISLTLALWHCRS